MSVCPRCTNTFTELLPGQLCETCRAEVLANDVYSSNDLTFVAVLAAFFVAALASMPGAFVGYTIGLAFDQSTRGCTIGVVVFVLAGLIAGYRIGPAIIARMEQTKRIKAH